MPKRKTHPQLPADFEVVAIASLLPGMRKLFHETEQYMRQMIEEMETRYTELMSASGVYTAKDRATNARSGWSEDPEERSAEMRRRQEVAKKKRASANYAKARKRTWAKKTEKEKANWLAKMQAGRKKARREAASETPVVKMAVAS